MSTHSQLCCAKSHMWPPPFPQSPSLSPCFRVIQSTLHRRLKLKHSQVVFTWMEHREEDGKKKTQSPLHHFTAGKGWFLILNYYRRTISVWRQTCSGTTRATWILLSTLPKCGPGKFTCMRPYPLWDILTKSHNNEWYELWRTSWQNCHGSIPSQNIVIPQAWRAKETDHHHQQP